MINFRKHNKNFSLSLQYNGVNSYVFFDGVETIKLKAKDSEIKVTPLYLINISKKFSVDIWKIQDYMDMFMILVMISCWWYIRYSQVFDEKEDNVYCSNDICWLWHINLIKPVKKCFN